MGGADHDRTLVMGVINVTPDSFSDGGHWLDPVAAVQHGLELLQQGADILDVGGESTRPGAVRVDPAQEIERVVPVVRELSERGAVVSVDTMRAQVAEACIRVGAQLVNDVSGGLADAAMLPLIARHDVDYVAMHWRGHARTMQQQASYSDVVADVFAELSTRRDAALAAGVQLDRLILDPGLGFAKRAEHNWQLLAALPHLMELGPRILVGASRKAFLGELLNRREPATRDDASLAVTCHCAQRRVWAVRTHTAQPHADAVRVMARLAAGGQ